MSLYDTETLCSIATSQKYQRTSVGKEINREHRIVVIVRSETFLLVWQAWRNVTSVTPIFIQYFPIENN